MKGKLICELKNKLNLCFQSYFYPTFTLLKSQRGRILGTYLNICAIFISIYDTQLQRQLFPLKAAVCSVIVSNIIKFVSIGEC